MQENYHGRLFITALLSIIFVLVVVAIGISFFLMKKQANLETASTTTTNEVANNTEEQIPQNPYKGTLFLHTPGDQTNFSVGETVEIDVYADSDGHDIVGYDLDLTLPEGVEFVSATSILDTFTSYTSSKQGQEYITVVKALGATEPIVFQDEPVLTVTVRLTQPGVMQIQPVYIPGSISNSSLMDSKTVNVLGSVQGVTLNVQ